MAVNDATTKKSFKIFDELMMLKQYIQVEDPECTVIISCPTPRFDNAYAQFTIKNLQKKVSSINKDHVILNDNINESHISKKGLYLNGKGPGRLAMNFKSHIRSKF